MSVIVPTRNRPKLLQRAVDSALGQTFHNLEVIVVDDGSYPPAQIRPDPRVRLIRLPVNMGGAAARNAGGEAAIGRWVTFLDDDDLLLPHMVQTSLDGIAGADLPPPIAAISGVQVIGVDGQVEETRLPPTRPRGSHFALEKLEPDCSYHTKQTLVVEREVITAVGWDEGRRSKVHTELFLRLNPVCSLVGLRIPTYQLYAHRGPRVSRDTAIREASFDRLVEKHQVILKEHPEGYARLLYREAINWMRHDQVLLGATYAARAAKQAPWFTAKLAWQTKWWLPLWVARKLGYGDWA